jgi:hypothetical protein
MDVEVESVSQPRGFIVDFVFNFRERFVSFFLGQSVMKFAIVCLASSVG